MPAHPFRTDRPVGPAGAIPPGQPAISHRHHRSRHAARYLTVVAVAAGAVIGIAGAQARITPTSATFTSSAAPQVNTIRAWTQTTMSTCNPHVEEADKNHPDVSTASCLVTVVNHGAHALSLDVSIATNSVSNNDKPVEYYDGPATTPPPKADPKHGMPDYSESLYITDTAGIHYGFGSLDCPTPAAHALATCSSNQTTPAAVTLQPGDSDTFTVTVHLNHGGHNGATLTVDLAANVGAGTMGALTTTFGLS